MSTLTLDRWHLRGNKVCTGVRVGLRQRYMMSQSAVTVGHWARPLPHGYPYHPQVPPSGTPVYYNHTPHSRNNRESDEGSDNSARTGHSDDTQPKEQVPYLAETSWPDSNVPPSSPPHTGNTRDRDKVYSEQTGRSDTRPKERMPYLAETSWPDSNVPPCRTPSVQTPAPRKEKVFITYSNDSPHHLSMVLDMARLLYYYYGYSVEVDMFQRHFITMDRMSWLDDRVQKSDFIIVVCSPKYCRDVSGGGPDEDDDHGLNTRYINRALQVTYLQNRCINYRVIPIIFQGYARDVCPMWLRNTTLYRWPRDIQDVMCRLRREERYKMPPPGRPPVIVTTRDFT